MENKTHSTIFDSSIKHLEKMNIVFLKTKQAQPIGEYKPTSIDKIKLDVDFLIVSIIGNIFTIDWKDGRREIFKGVRTLNKYKKEFTWSVNF